MIFRNKLFWIYLAICPCIFEVAFFNSAYEQYVFSDVFFTYWFTPIYLVGFTIISGGYSHETIVRYGSRKKVVLSKLCECELLVFVLSSEAIISMIACHMILGLKAACPSQLLLGILNLLLGASLLSMLTILLQTSSVVAFRGCSEIISFAIVLLEVIFLVPEIRMITGMKIPFIFTWLFYSGSSRFFVLPILCLLLLFFTLRRSHKFDWM